MTWTLCLSGAAYAKAGLNADPKAIAFMDQWSTDAERQIEAETGMSIVTNFAGYVLSGAASSAASSLIAMNVIAYNPTGYLSREADTLLNINDGIYKSNIKNMKDFKKTTLNNPN